MTDLGAVVDPALGQQLLTRTGSTIVPSPTEAHADDVVPVIARIDPAGADVPGLRVVSRFGGVVTARVRLADLATVRTHRAVRSLKAIRTYGPTLATTVTDVRARPTDLPRRAPGGPPLTGAGVLVAVLDWGIDVTHANLRNADGRTAVEAIWDQRGGRTPTSPEPFGYGRVLPRAAIDAALTTADPHAALGYDHADVDPTGVGTHGTHVADIVVGRGRAPGASPGMAPGASLAFVHLRGEDTAPEDTLGDSARILEACDWAVRCAAGRPLVIHMSLGRTGGPHDDTLLVTRAFDHLLTTRPGVAIVMSCGNYHDSRMHATVRVERGAVVDLPWDVPVPPAGGTELELWYDGRDRLAVSLLAPDGSTALALEPGGHAAHRVGGAVVASGFSRLDDPNNGDNVVDLFLQPGVQPGRWTIRLTGRTVHDGRVEAWIERTGGSHQARFPGNVATHVSTTGSICNGRLPLAVGAYETATDQRLPTRFSSEGPTRDGRLKPDVSGPGEAVEAARSSYVSGGRRVRDGLTRKSGTSMAAPHVSGAVALLFEAALPRRLPMAVTRWVVLESARPPGRADPRYGAGLLDAAAACRLALDLIPPHPGPARGGPPPPAPSRAPAREATALPGGTMTISTAPDHRVLAWLQGEDEPLDEAVLGTLTLNRPRSTPFTHRVDTRAPVRTATDADGAVIEALTDRTGHQVVTRTTSGWQVAPFGPAVCWITTPVAGFDGAGVQVITVNGGERVYVPDDPGSPGARRVDVPGLRSFYGLTAQDRNAQRDAWAERLAGATTLTATQARALGVPILRATLAHHGAAAFGVRGVRRGNPSYDAGGVVNGVTLPPLVAPLREPDCYLPVISRVEGKMESINAWDAGAGISLGPIQFNVDRAALFRFLWQLHTEDPVLFASALGTPLGWTMLWDGDHPDLVITRGTATDTLHGRAADSATNATYLMRGEPGPGRRDPDYRRRLAGCFRDAVVWPHVQQMVVDTTSWWLGPALTRIRAAGIGPLDPSRPDRDTFVLTALLLSAGVRYSGCLPQILTRLARWTTVADKLAHLDEAVAASPAPCPELAPRLAAQRGHAGTVFAQVRRLLAPPAAGEAVPVLEVVPAEGTGFTNPWATSILETIRPGLTATGHSPENWWDGMVDPVWLGRRFTNGIHEVLHRKLRAGETALRRSTAYASLTDADLGRALGITEGHGGARNGRSSMHSFGLATDIQYTGSPWILGNPDSPVSNESMRQACNRAALLLGGRVVDTAPPFLSDLARGTTASAYDALRTLDRELVAYLGLAGDTTAARVHVDRHSSVAGVVRTGESADTAAARWAEQARVDLDRLRLPGSNFAMAGTRVRDPRRGFLALHRDLVIALRDHGGLAWGAIDFGPQSGDVMHFDARPDGVGRVVLGGIRAARGRR